MAERRRGTVRDLRRDNRSVLLWSLYFDQPRSRQDLSRSTGLSPASVSNVVRDLIDEGIVIEAGSVDSDGGRPRVLLRIDPDHGYVIGVDVGETRVRVELFDLALTERAKVDHPLDPGEREVDVVVDRILAGLAAVLAGGRRRAPRRCSASASACPASSSRARRRSCTGRPTGGTRYRWSGCCAPAPTCRCTSRTARRPWARPRCGSARAAARGTPWSR